MEYAIRFCSLLLLVLVAAWFYGALTAPGGGVHVPNLLTIVVLVTFSWAALGRTVTSPRPPTPKP